MELEKLYKSLNYEFNDPKLLINALTHSSFINESGKKIKDNERLEFLGDAVICLAVTHILMDRFPEATEGEMSKLRASIVSENSLYHIAIHLGIGDMLLLGKGEEKSGGREKSSILADAVEAIFGALYLDAGFTKTLEIAKKIFSNLIDNNRSIEYDYKSRLQEKTQKLFGVLPEYRVVEEKGPPHKKVFKVALFINNTLIAELEGNSKKEAEQKLAKEGLNWIKR